VRSSAVTWPRSTSRAELSLDDRAQAVLLGAVWGNQADLGFRLNAELTDVNSPERQHLIHDDSAAVRSYLGAEPGKVCLIADNAGTELLADLILVDDLPHTGMASKISIHVKPYPYYVSDTITADLLACLRRLAEGRGYGHAAADRLWRALREGRLAVDTHPFYCQPWSFHYMPADLAADLANGSARHRQRRSELPPARRRPSLACYRVFRGRDGVLPCVGTPEVRCRSRPGRDGRRRSGCC